MSCLVLATSFAAALATASPSGPAGDAPGAGSTNGAGSPALGHLDAATACLRRGLHACAITESDLAAGAEGLPAELVREALRIGAMARALSGDRDGAREAFRSLREAGSSFRPDPDADPRILEAFRAAHAAPTTTPQPAATPEAPPPGTAITTPPSAFFVSVGAGAGIPVGSARYGAGLAAALELGWRPDADTRAAGAMQLALTAQLHFAWLPIGDDLAIEPGEVGTLGVMAGVIGADLRVDLAPAWQLVAQLGAGLGRFARGTESSGLALALQAAVGAHWQLGDAFALRAELAPVLLIPFGDTPTGGHPAVLLRAEGNL